MLRTLHKIVCLICTVLAVIWALQITAFSGTEKMGAQTKNDPAYEAGNSAFAEGDFATAASHYRKAAEAGNPQAQYNLGLLSAGGNNLPRNEAEAVKWMQMSAGQGYLPAQRLLGTWYLAGAFTPYNPARAALWFRKAAEQNDETAMFFLGAMYAKGEGLKKDHDTAQGWFQLAAAKGFEVPAEYLTMEGVAALDAASKSVKAAPASVSQPVAPRRAAKVKDIQTGLAELGYNPGPADGLMGSRTRNAIKAFQKDANLAVDGKISDELMLRIEEKLNK